MPSASQDPDGSVVVYLGAKGIVELELVASGEKWGRGPSKDVHSANRAWLDSPAFHLVQALATLVTPDGDPAIEGFAAAAKPPSAADKAILDAAASRLSEATVKRLTGVTKWAHDDLAGGARAAHLQPHGQHRGAGRPGTPAPEGKTVLPHRAVAKLDLRLVPDMTYEGALAALKAHFRSTASATSR